MTSASSRSSSMDAKLLSTLERAFASHAGGDARIDLADLQKALGLRSEHLTRRMMQLFDANGDGVITKDEFIGAVRALIAGSDRDKLYFAFRLHDENGDGFLDRGEIARMIGMSLAESNIAEQGNQTPDQLAQALLRTADRDGDGRISFDELAAFMQRRPDLLRKITRNEAIWIAPNEELLVWFDEQSGGPKAATYRWGFAGALRWVLLGAFFATNVALFLVSWFHDGGDAPPVNPLYRAGRALALCADLDGALILLPMMRRLLTRLRATWLGRVLPVDDANDFHRIVGHTLFAVALAHVGFFVAAFATGHAHGPFLNLLRTERGLSGVLVLAVFTVMWVFALRVVRAGKRFELFYFTHLLYVAWFVLAIFHAPRFGLWAAVPLAGFVLEQILRLARRGAPTVIRSSVALRSGVTRLEIERPAGFQFRAGDYAFLCVPDIARHEWHPFTISSAPERERITFHARSLGDWTNALRRRVEAQPDAPEFSAYLDGPYGAPSGRVFEARFVVLIGAGIGVTPFASILESLVLRSQDPRRSKVERVHFFWLNKDQYSFEWFVELLAQLEAQDARGLLDIHLHITGARAGMSSLGLEVARAIMRAGGRTDYITGLRTETHVGPPDWDVMLGAIAKNHAPHTVEVFYCGPPGLEVKLRKTSARYGMTFTTERF